MNVLALLKTHGELTFDDLVDMMGEDDLEIESELRSLVSKRYVRKIYDEYDRTVYVPIKKRSKLSRDR